MAHILVVDDEASLRSLLAECLESHDVVTAGDGEEAIAKLSKQSFHLVVTDLKMPKVGGLELLKHIKAHEPQMEVIVLSAHGSVDTAVEAMRVGAFDFLEKPIESPAAFRALVTKSLDHQRLRSQVESNKVTQSKALTWGAPSMAPVVKAIERVAPTEATVLLLGESGTGKEVAARTLHELSERREGPFVAVNCAVLSDTLMESELFGHEKGAFTGAERRKRGKLELAEKGTFFLDEVAELKVELQAKLLRVLQEKEFVRVGGDQVVPLDARIVAATHQNLGDMIAAGQFREDLYHRLSVFPISLPALRERPEDLPNLCAALLSDIGRDMGRHLELSPEALEGIASDPWSGNIRALRNALERAAIMSDGDTIDGEALSLPNARVPGKATPSGPQTMADIERDAVARALKQNQGNRKRAAEELGIGERTLYDKIKKYDLS